MINDYQQYDPPPAKPTILKRVWTAFVLCVLAWVVWVLAGCASYQAVVAERGAQASDDATAATLWALCNALPVGAIRREFNTEAEQTAYEAICPPP